MENKKNRKIKLINPDFQLRFAFNCLVPMLIMSTIFWLTIETFIFRMIAMGKEQGLPETHAYFQLIQVQRYELLKILLLLSVVLAIIFFVWALIYSHRIAGPLYKLVKWLEETEDLKSAVDRPVQFRKKDFFLEIPKSLNKFVKKL